MQCQVTIPLLCPSPARLGSDFLISCSINSSVTEEPPTTYSTIGYTRAMPRLNKCGKYEEKISYVDSSNCTSDTPVTKSLC